MNTMNNLAKIGGDAAPDVPLPAAAGQFLVFRVAQSEYGVALEHVRKVMPCHALTRVSKNARLVDGVAIVDGAIIALVDLRAAARRAAPAAVLILTLSGRTIGMLVDDVADLVAPAASQIGALPHDAASHAGRRLIGVATVGQRSVLLLDLEALLFGAPPASDEKRAA